MATIHRFSGKQGAHYTWTGQRTQRYAGQNGTDEAVLHWLIGKAEGAPTFAMRYFELPPGHRSNPESHAYEHGIIVVRGRATVVLGEDKEEVLLAPLDVLFIPPNEFHQFINASEDEVFGAFCTIPAYREKNGRIVYAEGDLVPDEVNG
jgi:quercetin dioxygenase-like cupin family protein